MVPAGRAGVLASATPSSFVTAILTPSTSYTLETNRFSLLLKAQVFAVPSSVGEHFYVKRLTTFP